MGCESELSGDRLTGIFQNVINVSFCSQPRSRLPAGGGMNISFGFALIDTPDHIILDPTPYIYRLSPLDFH